MARRVKGGLRDGAGYHFDAAPAPTTQPTVDVPAIAEQPHYAGHRDRLRERFAAAGADALADYEMLELLLFRSIPRRDVKPIAKALLKRFGGLSEVAGAGLSQLCEVDGVGHATALDLKIVSAFNRRSMRAEIAGRNVIANFTMIVDYLAANMTHEGREQFRVLYLDKRNGLIADEVQHFGTVDFTPVTPRELIRRALELDASALILCHNHPSGDVRPSMPDVEMTRIIIDMAKPFGIQVHDHVIVGRGKALSMRSDGYLS